jgi:hypothetical protein
MTDINGYNRKTTDTIISNDLSSIIQLGSDEIDLIAGTVLINGASIGSVQNPMIVNLDCANNDITNIGVLGIASLSAFGTAVINDSTAQSIKITALETKTQNIVTTGTNTVIGNVSIDDNTINGLTPVGGLYSGLSDGALISGGTLGSLLPLSGVGALTVPANGFNVGDVFHLVCSGDIPVGDKDDIITITLNQNGTQLAVISVDMEDSINTYFELEADFQVRSIGVSGQLVTNFDFTFNKQLLKDFKGSRKVQLSTINTTTASTLSLTAIFTGQFNSSIKTRLFYLRKQF